MEINGSFNPISAKRARDNLGVTSEFNKRSKNVLDYGAKLDGTDDTAAFQATRAATAKNGVIDIPQGQFVKSQEILDGPEAGKVLWRLAGNSYGSGAAPVLGVGFDAVESVINGGKYFGRQNSKPNDGPVLRIDSTINSTQTGETGFSQNVINAFQTNMVIPKNAAEIGNFGWAASFNLTSSAWGTGQHVGLACLAVRPSNALSDGKGARSVIWAQYAEVRDQTGQDANTSGSMAIAEWDMYGNGLTGGPGQNQRIGLHMLMSRDKFDGPAMRANYGTVIATNDSYVPGISVADYSYVGVGHSIQLGFDKAGFDTSEGRSIGSAPAFKMAAGQRIAFDGNAETGYRRSLFWADGTLNYATQNGVVLQVNDGGDVITPNALVANRVRLSSNSRPTGPNDTSGTIGDLILAGVDLFAKTTSGWAKLAGTLSWS